MNNACALAVRSAQLYRSEVPHWTKPNPKRTEARSVQRWDAVLGSCVDGSELARAFFTFCSIGRCSHVFGLEMRFT
jgi:hypothetical protein